MAFTFNTGPPQTNFNKAKSMKITDIFTKQNSRKTLQTIQCTADGQKQTNGKGNIFNQQKKAEKIKISTEPVKVFEDPKQVPRFESKEIQASPIQECKETQTEKKEQLSDDELAYKLMVDAEPPPEYWTMIAERRREALSEALGENLQLHQEILQLKEENEKLHELSGQAEYFAEVIKDFLGDAVAEQTSEDKDSNKESDNESGNDSAESENDSAKSESESDSPNSEQKDCDSTDDDVSECDIKKETSQNSSCQTTSDESEDTQSSSDSDTN